MSNPPLMLRSLTLTGFRAYLEPKTFDFSPKPNLAIFAPNGKGKSGLVDALEFLLSKDGTIKRLGLRAVNNQAGVAALAHDLAAEKKKPSEVRIALKRDNKTYDGTRSVSGNRARPDALDPLVKTLRADPIIRGYTLRQFVEDQSPEDRYTEVGNWLRFSPLVEVQKNLRLLRQQVKADAESLASRAPIDAQLAKLTSSVLNTWDESAICGYIDNLLALLDATLRIKTLDRADPAVATLAKRVEAEEKELGVVGLRQIETAISTVYAEETDENGHVIATSGAIENFESAVADKLAAENLEASERSQAANAIFSELWKAAEPLFADRGAPLANCPVCATPISQTAAGSRDEIYDHIRKHRAELASYAAAKANLDRAAQDMIAAQRSLIGNFTVLQTLISFQDSDIAHAIAVYRRSIDQWKAGACPDSIGLKVALGRSLTDIRSKISEIQRHQGEHTYSKVHVKIQSLLDLKHQLELRDQTHSESQKLLLALNEQTSLISTEIRKRVQELLDMLREPTNRIYRSIQGQDAAHVLLELPSEDETNQQKLALLIDFSPARQRVPPSGYLSDSQVHSLALALRLSAIATFNAEAPIAVLDDIVTSYDADHRRAIAGMIAKHLPDLQIIVTTHDQRFFSYLKDQLPQAEWSFTQIIRLDRDYGPRFSDHKISDEMIQARWADGQSAANEIRQAEEEWLLDRCREFGVDVRIRDVDRAYSYERSELALALATFLKSAGIAPPSVPGVSNRFLISLQKGEIENFGSHFQEAPYGDGSIGDEKVRWAEFKFFRDHFACPACRRKKFKRPLTLKKPVCAHDKCEAQFQFVSVMPTLLDHNAHSAQSTPH
jgi:energy-coupling factor transporter ATP-binding protein EcfA2